MRKYYQAALVVTAVISLISLLIYRNQYNKLRYVLQVLNYFGKYEPKGANNSCISFNSTFTELSPRFDEPIPSWQRLENDLYVYGAHSITYQSQKEIRAVGVGIATSILNTQCLIFFDNESKPILGNFNFIPMMYSSTVNNSTYRGYHLVCTYSSNETPTGITFITKSNRYLNYAPILPIRIPPQQPSDNSGISVCVMRSSMKSTPPNMMDMIGFISFHTLIGMDNFIVYDDGIPSILNSGLKRMANGQSSGQGFTYTVIPWNYPFMEINELIMQEVAVADCLYRSYNSVAYSIILSWNEYVVPRYHRTTLDLMRDIKKTESAFDRYRLTLKLFCTQQPDNKKSANSPLTLFKKTKSSVASMNRFVHIYYPHEIVHAELQNYRGTRTSNIGKNLISVHRYEHCEGDDIKSEEDSTALRFVDGVQNSSIFKQYREFYDMININVK